MDKAEAKQVNISHQLLFMHPDIKADTEQDLNTQQITVR